MATQPSKEPRRFAPLSDTDGKVVAGVPKLRGVVFDVDGTLWYISIPFLLIILCESGESGM